MKFKILGKYYDEKEVNGMKVRAKSGDEETTGEIVGYVENLPYPYAVFIIKQFKINKYFDYVEELIMSTIFYFGKTARQIGNGVCVVLDIIEILNKPTHDTPLAYFNSKRQDTVLKLDGVEYRVKLSKDDKFDKYLGVAYLEAIAKYGSKTAFKKHVDEIWRETQTCDSGAKIERSTKGCAEDLKVKILDKEYTIEELSGLEVEIRANTNYNAPTFDKTLRTIKAKIVAYWGGTTKSFMVESPEIDTQGVYLPKDEYINFIGKPLGAHCYWIIAREIVSVVSHEPKPTEVIYPKNKKELLKKYDKHLEEEILEWIKTIPEEYLIVKDKNKYLAPMKDVGAMRIEIALFNKNNCQVEIIVSSAKTDDKNTKLVLRGGGKIK